MNAPDQNQPPLPDLLKVLSGQTLVKPPIWFMRQAGRYLPEYRALRARAPDFISFCLNPDMAAEATLQPMRRFEFSAAIVFADILLLPQALGQEVRFEVGEGPKLGALPSLEVMRSHIDTAASTLSNIGETLSRVRAELAPDKALIGFAGAPWTVATYMIEGGSSDRVAARTYAYTNAKALDDLIDILVDATAQYLVMQARSGAQVLKLFESWAEGLPEDLFERLVIGPHARIIAQVRAAGISAPFIGFPRGAGALVQNYAQKVAVQAVALDVQASASMGQDLQKSVAIQGALDPLLLRAGGKALDVRLNQLLAQWGQGPYIFNLGHGILPDTPIAHVEQVLARVVHGK